MNSALELQIAFVDLLRGSTQIASILGGQYIYDDVPDNQQPPYVQIGLVETLDWSTTTEEGGEHFFEFAVWSQTNGRRPAVEIASLICQTLLASEISLPSHELINLTHEATITQAESDDRHYVARVTFRGVTEPKTL